MKNILLKMGVVSAFSVSLFANVFMTAPLAQACSCVMPGTPAEELERSDAVFSGTVVDIRNSNAYGYESYEVTLEVQEAWKGVTESTVTVQTGMGGGDCGFGFEVEKKYLVYASRSEEELHVSICSLTGLLAGADTENLGSGTVYSQNDETDTPLNPWARPMLAVLAMGVLAGLAVVYRPKK